VSDSPKIYVFCNSCSPQWHSATALSEDGFFLAGHVCSSHGFIHHDMGVDENGWKRDTYEAHYPGGFEVEYVDHEIVRSRKHAGIEAAYTRHTTMTDEARKARLKLRGKVE